MQKIVKVRRSSESAGVGTLGESASEALSGGRAGLLLEPRDELGDGEGLGEVRAGAGASASLSGGSGLSSGGGGRGLLRGSGGGGSRSRSSGRGRSRGAARVVARARASAAGTVPDSRAGDGVAGAAVSSALDVSVDVAENTGVLGGVDLGHVHTGGELGSARAGDLDLTAAVVQLGLALGASLVEGNDLGAEVVVARGKVGDGNVDETLVVVELVDGPGGAGKTLLLDLDPDLTLTLGLSRGHVDHDGALVGGSNGLVLVARGITGAVVVVPLDLDLGASGNLDEVGGLSSTVADHGLGGDIEDGVVGVGRGLDTLVLASILAVNDEGLESGVAVGELGSGESESNSGLHFDGWWVVCVGGLWWKLRVCFKG